MRLSSFIAPLVAASLAFVSPATAQWNEPHNIDINFANMLSGITLGGSCSNGISDCTLLEPSMFSLKQLDPDQIVQSMLGECPSGDRPSTMRWCVQPRGTVDVHVEVVNNGTRAWKKGAITMAPIMEPVWPDDKYSSLPLHHTPINEAWRSLVLDLVSDVPVGGRAQFRGLGIAPTEIGIHELFFQAYTACGPFGSPVTVRIEVTCSDFNFCNGEERYENGVGCVPARNRACDDGFNCTRDTCDEKHRTCWFEVVDREACETCDRQKCTPSCAATNYCGEDRCGGYCPCGSGLACKDSQCVDPSQLTGSCQKPFTFITAAQGLNGSYKWNVNNGIGVHQVRPTCNDGTYAPEVVYVFDVPYNTSIGVDIRLYDATLVLGSDLTSTLDTVVELRESACLDSEYDRSRAWCSDDSVPPGGSGSRVTASLVPGKRYYIIVDSYSIDNVGLYTVHVQFTPGYVRTCDAKFCGPDGGGGDCGPCEAGFECSLKSNRCFPKQCVPNCAGKSCGPDGCDGECGSCTGDALCVRKTGQCQVFPKCDHKKPACTPGCGKGEFCANDCQCHSINEDLPDYILLAESARDSLVIEQKYIDNLNCAVAEKCVSGTGWRRLLRMTVEAINQGFGNLDLPLPEERPDMFIFSPCHGHYHYEGFALYELLADDGSLVAKRKMSALGHKQAYCLEDSYQYLQGPRFRCAGVHYCSTPGTSAGWSDFYGVDLDCQWVDITGLPSGNYTLRLEVNAARGLLESNFENNAVELPVYIPPPSNAEQGFEAASRNKKSQTTYNSGL